MKSLALMLVSAVVAVSCDNSQSNNNPNNVRQSEEERSNDAEARFGYLRRDHEIIGVPYKAENGLALIGGDILLPTTFIKKSLEEAQLGLASWPGISLWANGRVPYELPADMEYQAEWESMVAAWGLAGIRWEVRKPEDKEFVRVIMGTPDGKLAACGVSLFGKIPSREYGNLGVSGSGQPLWLMSTAQRSQLHSGACDMARTILHEAAHALGFGHEHQRSDRDNFVRFAGPVSANDVNWRKLEGGKNYNPYDYSSITHYATGQSGAMDMRKINGDIIPLTVSLSAGDIEAARAAYSLPLPPMQKPTQTVAATATPAAKPTIAATTTPAAKPTIAATVIPTAKPTITPTTKPAAVATPWVESTTQPMCTRTVLKTFTDGLGVVINSQNHPNGTTVGQCKTSCDWAAKGYTGCASSSCAVPGTKDDSQCRSCRYQKEVQESYPCP